MIVVKIELHSANTGEVTELGRAIIANVGGTRSSGNYDVRVARKGTTDLKSVWGSPARTGSVTQYPRLTYNVWRLVSRAIRAAFPEEL